jgi:DNA-binding response OmpR family regulator
MGSEIAVSSAPGQGCCFSFTLRCPLAEPPAAELYPPAPAPRVLLVDDDPQQLQLLGDLLDNAGFISQQANSGRAAVEQLGNGHWDAIVTDQMMADGDGWFVLRQVRAAGQAVPVVLLSAALPQRPDGLPADLEFDATLRKPALSEDLLATLWALVLKVGAGGTAISAAQWQELAILAGDGDVSGIEDWIAAMPASPVRDWARAALNRLDFDLIRRSAMIAPCSKQ